MGKKEMTFTVTIREEVKAESADQASMMLAERVRDGEETAFIVSGGDVGYGSICFSVYDFGDGEFQVE